MRPGAFSDPRDDNCVHPRLHPKRGFILSAQVFMPRVPTWALVASGAAWLGLTALSVVLGDIDSFGTKFGGQLASTAAGIAFAVTGVGTLVQSWQRRRMREKTGPIAIQAITDATQAMSQLANYYLSASRPALPGAGSLVGKLTFRNTYNLLAPPLLENRTDLEPFQSCQSEAFDRAVSLMKALPTEPSQEQKEFVSNLHAASSQLSAAESELERAVKALVDFEAPCVEEVFKTSIQVRIAVSSQEEALRHEDPATSAQLSWMACFSLFKAVLDMAGALDGCWKEMSRLAGPGQHFRPETHAMGKESVLSEVRNEKELAKSTQTVASPTGDSDARPQPSVRTGPDAESPDEG